MYRYWIVAGLLSLAFLVTPSRTAWAQLTLEHKKDLAELSKEVAAAASLIKKKEFGEAGKTLDAVTKKLEDVAKAAGLTEADPNIRRVHLQVARQRATLEKADPSAKKESKPVSFALDVAPIITARCVECHGADNPRGSLCLDAFAGWRTGGKSGVLIVPGNAARSLLIARLKADEGQGRMPRRGDPLTAEQIQTISDWINQGAKFDGGNERSTLADVTYNLEMKTLNIKLPKSTGSEQVKFTRDIAPWFTNLCLGCHNAQRKSGGLSVATYYDLMKGGDSGEVIIPGDMENSRLFRLVGGLELPRMPQGQRRITRQNYEDLKRWFQEGNTFDGPDPRALISSFTPAQTPPQTAPNPFASMTDAEMRPYRQKHSLDQLKRSLLRTDFATATSDDFLMFGTVSDSRLKEVFSWAQGYLDTLNKTYGDHGHPWRGRLAVFVLEDRSNFEDFMQIVVGKRPSSSQTDYSSVTEGLEEAFVVLQDVGDEPARGLSLKAALGKHLGQAYIQQTGKPTPDWLARGVGLLTVESAFPPQYAKELQTTAASLGPAVSAPEEMLAEGAFSPEATEAVGYTLVKYLIDTSSPKEFGRFVDSLLRGQTADAAMQAAFGSGSSAIASGYFNSLKSR